MILYPIGTTGSCLECARELKKAGICLIDHPAPEVTHLLLDVPSFTDDGNLPGGQNIEQPLSMLPETVTLIGGNLEHRAVEKYNRLDLLKDARYLAANAAITADCAIRLAGSRMDFVFSGATALIIGWGRIGKCLARLLWQLGCQVTVAARKEADRAMAEALGYAVIETDAIPDILEDTQLLFNTVPAPVVDVPIPERCIALELASKSGIFGDRVISARGLPGKYAPVSAGKNMAKRILDYCREVSS